MSLGIIIQARTGSERFPGKVLASLDGSPVVQHVIDRCLAVLPPNGRPRVILAVPYADAGKFYRFGVPVVYGPEHDVLERYFIAAKAYQFDTIVRITADCPLIPPEIIKMCIDEYHLGGGAIVGVDYPKGGWPKGYGVEVFNWFTLNLAHVQAKEPEDREHVTKYMWENYRAVRITNPAGDQSSEDYCVDYREDIPRLERYMREQKVNKT